MKTQLSIDVSTEFADSYFEDGILFSVLTNADSANTFESIKNHIDAVLNFYSGILPAPNIVIVDKIKQSNKAMRHYLSTNEMKKVFKAMALVLEKDSIANRAAGNLYLKFAKMPVPTRIFNSIENAQKWLAPYR